MLQLLQVPLHARQLLLLCCRHSFPVLHLCCQACHLLQGAPLGSCLSFRGILECCTQRINIAPQPRDLSIVRCFHCLKLASGLAQLLLQQDHCTVLQGLEGRLQVLSICKLFHSAQQQTSQALDRLQCVACRLLLWLTSILGPVFFLPCQDCSACHRQGVLFNGGQRGDVQKLPQTTAAHRAGLAVLHRSTGPAPAFTYPLR